MSLPTPLRQKLLTLLQTDAPGARLADDAQRLWKRVQKFGELSLIAPQIDTDALELACWAVQLPASQPNRAGRSNFRQRCEQAAELLVSLAGDTAEESLLDRTTRLLHESSHKSPVIDEARLLADAINLDDFGLVGLFAQALQISQAGEGIGHLVDALDKREQYGYWSARLKEGFFFPQIRAIAARRLETARKVAKMLADELAADQITPNKLTGP